MPTKYEQEQLQLQKDSNSRWAEEAKMEEQRRRLAYEQQHAMERQVRQQQYEEAQKERYEQQRQHQQMQQMQQQQQQQMQEQYKQQQQMQEQHKQQMQEQYKQQQQMQEQHKQQQQYQQYQQPQAHYQQQQQQRPPPQYSQQYRQWQQQQKQPQHYQRQQDVMVMQQQQQYRRQQEIMAKQQQQQQPQQQQQQRQFQGGRRMRPNDPYGRTPQMNSQQMAYNQPSQRRHSGGEAQERPVYQAYPAAYPSHQQAQPVYPPQMHLQQVGDTQYQYPNNRPVRTGYPQGGNTRKIPPFQQPLVRPQRFMPMHQLQNPNYMRDEQTPNNMLRPRGPFRGSALRPVRSEPHLDSQIEALKIEGRSDTPDFAGQQRTDLEHYDLNTMQKQYQGIEGPRAASIDQQNDRIRPQADGSAQVYRGLQADKPLAKRITDEKRPLDSPFPVFPGSKKENEKIAEAMSQPILEKMDPSEIDDELADEKNKRGRKQKRNSFLNGKEELKTSAQPYGRPSVGQDHKAARENVDYGYSRTDERQIYNDAASLRGKALDSESSGYESISRQNSFLDSGEESPIVYSAEHAKEFPIAGTSKATLQRKKTQKNSQPLEGGYSDIFEDLYNEVIDPHYDEQYLEKSLDLGNAEMMHRLNEPSSKYEATKTAKEVYNVDATAEGEPVSGLNIKIGDSDLKSLNIKKLNIRPRPKLNPSQPPFQSYMNENVDQPIYSEKQMKQPSQIQVRLGGYDHQPPDPPMHNQIAINPPQSQLGADIQRSNTNGSGPEKLQDTSDVSVLEEPKQEPVTLRDLAMYQKESQGGSPEAKLKYVKALAEAAVTLADKNGQVSPKEAKKNRQVWCDEAYKLLKKLSTGKESYPSAMFYLAQCFGNGILNLQIDHCKAFSFYRDAAKKNYGPSAYRTAVCYEIGAGVRKDNEKAMKYYRLAAKLGDVNGMYKLGMIYKNGLLGYQTEFKAGLTWLEKAARSATIESPHALHELGLLYESSDSSKGVLPQDLDKAFVCFRQAAKLQYAPSQYRLGYSYENGSLNCPFNPRKSIAWYVKGAEQGHADCELGLSGWYLTGADGILEQNDREAFLWADRAAEQGLAKAEFALGYFYEHGIGVNMSIDEAKLWYTRAAEQGNKRAMTRLSELRKSSTKVSLAGSRK